MNEEIFTAMLQEPKRGPGGHPLRYQAWVNSRPEPRGYGNTAAEATRDLKSKLEAARNSDVC